MMRRRTRPSARTTRTAPTAPCVPVSRDGARVPRSVPPVAGPVTGNGSCTSVEGGSERSTGSPATPRAGPREHRSAAAGIGRRAAVADRARARGGRAGDLPGHLRRTATTTTSCGRRRPSSRATRRSAIPSRPTAGLHGNAFFQDVLPIATSDGVPRGLLPFPPLPAVVLVPFVALWGLATNDQLLFTRPGGDRRRALLVDARAAAGRPAVAARDDRLLRLRDGLLVHRQRRDDLVPGAHRGGRPDVPRDRARARRRPRRRGDEPATPSTGRDATIAPVDRAAPAPPTRPAAAIDRRQFAGRLPVRACLHGPADGRLRRAVLRLRRGRRDWRRPRLVGRARARRSRSSALLAYDVDHDRPR